MTRAEQRRRAGRSARPARGRRRGRASVAPPATRPWATATATRVSTAVADQHLGIGAVARRPTRRRPQTVSSSRASQPGRRWSSGRRRRDQQLVRRRPRSSMRGVDEQVRGAGPSRSIADTTRATSPATRTSAHSRTADGQQRRPGRRAGRWPGERRAGSRPAGAAAAAVSRTRCRRTGRSPARSARWPVRHLRLRLGARSLAPGRVHGPPARRTGAGIGLPRGEPRHGSVSARRRSGQLSRRAGARRVSGR